MNILLDTHTLIWAVTLDKHLTQRNRRILENADNRCLVSVASLWEMGIKYSIGKLKLKHDLKEIFEIIETTGFEILPITVEHILINSSLPLHHRDPFDRILVSQAMADGLSIMSTDEVFKHYNVKTVWK